ncbi:aldo/keto reductase [Ignisphaera sp. 4213-co]|uniref:Aldo/keto reductase n=1 Tax=Ignisphaera cupida TaxID=3050454 RepID=A0ABD4ZAB4_9CREN|nr:aldo/keto reductase [Ignisphaera sp. 4213-co]MDK6029245.1 aldo/keto reductase [Ignisphaera sp. 4213-co]
MVRDVKCFNRIGCISSLGMGTWGIGGGFWTPDYSMDRLWVEVLRTGLQLGMTLIDTAEMYGGGHSEEIVGEAIKGFDRESIFIVSKVWPSNASYENVLKSAKASSKRLNTYIDLYLLHWPSNDVHICETIKAFEKLVDEGVIRFYGLSNFTVRGIEEARSCTKKYDVVAIQNHFSLLHRDDEKDVIPYAQRKGLLYMAYTPLEKGQLAKHSFLAQIGRKYGKTATQVALNWLMCIDNVVPIPKAGTIEHVKENAGALGWRLSKEDWLEISRFFSAR